MNSANRALIELLSLPEPDEYPGPGIEQWNTYPFVSICEGSAEILLGADCEYLYKINVTEAEETALQLLAAANLIRERQ